MARRAGDQIVLTVVIGLAAIAVIVAAIHGARTGVGHRTSPLHAHNHHR